MSVAIITGASSGIGREFALQLKGRFGIDEFWLIARRKERLEALLSELGTGGRIITADLTTEDGISTVRTALEEAKPTVSFLLNGAGYGKFGSFDQLGEGDVRGMIDLNVKATVLITHLALPYMERGGRIVQMGSGSCFTPLPAFNTYAASKSFVLHYSKGLYYELKPYGISVTCFCPGWVDTEFLGRAESNPGVTVPKKTKPLLSAERVVRKCVKAADKRKRLCVTNWYTKLQHLLFKILPDCILSKLWCGMLSYPDLEKGRYDAKKRS